MSALPSGESTPFPYQTRNLTPPDPLRFDDAAALTVFEQRKLDNIHSLREAEIAKALAQEALRWEQGTIARETSRHQTAVHATQVLHFPEIGD